jgi:hypothetical protein
LTLKSTHVLDTIAERQETYRWLSRVRTLRARFLESPDHGIFCTARMNTSSAAPHAFAWRFASMRVRADCCHVASAAPFASLTAVAASRYAAASCATLGVGVGVAVGSGVAAGTADGGAGVAVGGGVAARVAEGGAGVALGAGEAAASRLVGATAGDFDDGDSQPAAVTARKTTTVTMTTA